MPNQNKEYININIINQDQMASKYQCFFSQVSFVALTNP